MKRILRCATMAAILLAAACAPAKIQRAGNFTIENRYAISTAQNWTRYSADQDDRWTVDGLQLEMLWTVAGLKAGELLLENGEETAPKFSPNLTTVELSEFFADSLRANHSSANVQVSKLEPAKFAGTDGFRFELEYNDEGLIRSAIAVGAVRDDMLDMVVFIAAKEHYFEYRRDAVEEIIKSIRPI